MIRKLIPACLLLCAFSLSAIAEDLTTLDKTTYRDVRLSRVDVDGIMILHSSGGGKTAFTNLPPKLQKIF